MAQQEPVRYERRTLSDWVEAARKGHVAIADFQRSFVSGCPKSTKPARILLLNPRIWRAHHAYGACDRGALATLWEK